jgi:hypothetical protein
VASWGCMSYTRDSRVQDTTRQIEEMKETGETGESVRAPAYTPCSSARLLTVCHQKVLFWWEVASLAVATIADSLGGRLQASLSNVMAATIT